MSKRPITTPLLSLYLVLLSFAAMLGFSNLAQAEAADPVSYTHLDVYKRQPLVPLSKWTHPSIAISPLLRWLCLAMTSLSAMTRQLSTNSSIMLVIFS